ncbi:MAG: PilZ domain-containing protein [Myxococcales bacterium]|nr:PilZ domain-containing protein [Myxococcales bacterium]
MAPDHPPPPERRREERVAARIEVHFGERMAAAKALRAYSLNFSAGGLCLKTQRAYAIGTPLELSLLVQGEPLSLKGIVAWTRQGAIGVRFEEVSPDARALLDQLLASLKQAKAG